MTMLCDNVRILLVSRHLFQLQATNSFADGMKIALVFPLFDRMYTLNRLWFCFLLSKVEKIRYFFKKKFYILQLLLIFYFFYNIATRIECIFFLCFLNFSCRDKINSSLYMCAYTPLIHMLYWSYTPFMKALLQEHLLVCLNQEVFIFTISRLGPCPVDKDHL